MTVRILVGDVREMLAALPDESVHCVVTSPPYWGLRDYGTAQWDGGNPDCDHQGSILRTQPPGTSKQASNAGACAVRSGDCACGARRIDRQLGMEPTVGEHIETMVDVFREVRRALRKDGTVWLNYGDCYATSGTRQGDAGGSVSNSENEHRKVNGGYRPRAQGLKEKDLCMIPNRIAIALQDDGWWVRSEIIWHKPNPMPESVTDRPATAHEKIWLLTRSARYYYDAEAVKIPSKSPGRIVSYDGTQKTTGHENRTYPGATPKDIVVGETSNLRNVWTIPTAPFSEAHFATFPPKLAETCIKAGTSEKGCCAECGAPWVREIERVAGYSKECPKTQVAHEARGGTGKPIGTVGKSGSGRVDPVSTTTGWSPSCACDAATVPCTVLDPFIGSGTTAMVADRLGRDCIGIELNPDYAEMARRRVTQDAGMFAEVS